jgi:predicted NUDIX family NTP pyrophosphohydrolase
MPKLSAGILLYRRRNLTLEVFLVHPGGPFWKNKDAGVWSIPKGEYETGEDPLAAALREFEEETGVHLAAERFLPLGEIKQSGGKSVTAWALEGDIDAARIRSNLFAIEWPPRSGKKEQFPEVDRAGWFDLPTAAGKLLAAQRELLMRLQSVIGECAGTMRDPA